MAETRHQVRKVPRHCELVTQPQPWVDDLAKSVYPLHVQKVDFGVGCLSLVPTKSVEDPTAAVDWQSTLTEGIGLLPSVTKLNVDIKNVLKEPLSEHDVLTKFRDQPTLEEVGIPSAGSVIRFEIVIPQRKHKELLFWLQEPLDCERFQFITLYTLHGPVTFINTMEKLPDEANAKFAVALVREFLKDQLSATESPVSLITTGPSPYHAIFRALPRDESTGEKEFDWEKRQLDYDFIRFYYRDDIELELSYRKLIVSVVDSFSHYYRLVRIRDRRRERAEVISGLTEILVDRHTSLGIRGWFVRNFRSGRLARQLILDIIRSKQLELKETREADEPDQKSATSGARLPFVQEACEEEAAEGYLDVLDSSQEIATILEGSRLKSYEVLVLATSTLLGGAAGAIAALVAS